MAASSNGENSQIARINGNGVAHVEQQGFFLGDWVTCGVLVGEVVGLMIDANGGHVCIKYETRGKNIKPMKGQTWFKVETVEHAEQSEAT